MNLIVHFSTSHLETSKICAQDVRELTSAGAEISVEPVSSPALARVTSSHIDTFVFTAVFARVGHVQLTFVHIWKRDGNLPVHNIVFSLPTPDFWQGLFPVSLMLCITDSQILTRYFLEVGIFPLFSSWTFRKIIYEDIKQIFTTFHEQLPHVFLLFWQQIMVI